MIGRGTKKQQTARYHSFLDADIEFHKIILLAARNPALARTVEQSHIQSRTFHAEQGVQEVSQLALTCKQHRAILAALDKRDGHAAAEAMRIHIRTALELTLENLETLRDF